MTPYLTHIPHISSSILRLTTAILLAASLFSCSDQDETVEMYPLRIGSASTYGTFDNGLAVSRAGTKTTELNQSGQSIGIFLEQDKNYDAINNRKYTYGSPFWTTDDGAQLLLGKEKANLAAYYPYSKTQTEPKVTLESRFYDETKEFYYLPFMAAYISSSVNLNLRRAYALIRFSFVRGEKDNPNSGDAPYDGTGSVSAFSFTTDLIATGTLDLLTGAVSGSTQKDVKLSCPPPELPFPIGSNASPESKDFMIVPMSSFTADLDFTATVDGKQMTGTLLAAQLCGTGNALKEGVMYEVLVTVRSAQLVVTDVFTVTARDSEDISNELENK